MLDTSRIVVDPARPADLDRIGEIGVNAFEAAQLLSADYAAVLCDVATRASDAVVLVARDGSEVLGSVTLATAGGRYADLARPGEVEVRMLAVDPAAQGRGAGEALLRAAIRWAAEHGHDALVLSVVSTDGPGTPHRLYERLGFRRDVGRDYVGDWESHPQMWCYRRPV
ncbi:GNAT family N-acetyltransferase [Georgenia sp. TF02-10]|uniref:GNAT family N-acetyltransferase n=1 Tax=Georgenia sp. TF02-10 TaxID=2917725 RepID=UPI001FA7F142|nr:GNAT family N-acetyltransferase [Georgenia sp. TF02-10]UNX53917.1 GNAT family N-acetyltransferase [Georgenia sp. TF02-10]